MPADTCAPGAPGPPVRAPPVCRHWSRGGCLYGETCRFAHPPDALGASPGVSESAGVLRRDSAVSPARTNRRVNKKGRCGHLRRFLIDTFGAECVGSGAPILDVGGGRGELAFELCNLNGADAFVVDVVPMRLARYESKLERGWYDRSAPLAKYNDRERRPSYIRSAAYDACSTATPQHETPKHLRLLWSPALWRVRDDAASRGEEYGRGADGDLPISDADEDEGGSFLTESQTASPRSPRTIDVISSLERDLTAETRERHAVATYSAWAAATRVAFSARGLKKKRADGDSRRDGCLSEEDSQKTTTVTDALLSFVHQHDPSVFVRGASRAETDPSCGASPPDSADADERVGVQNTSEDDDGESRCECADPLCGASPPDASLVRETLRACVMVVGMHSDQATEWIVDFALAHRVRFAVVPCCVCPGLFPRRRRVDGSGAPVRSHAEFCEYLRAKARPGEIELARLPFEGKNTVVYSAFDAKGGRGYRDRR